MIIDNILRINELLYILFIYYYLKLFELRFQDR